jgi:hypothetical protein
MRLLRFRYVFRPFSYIYNKIREMIHTNPKGDQAKSTLLKEDPIDIEAQTVAQPSIIKPPYPLRINIPPQ